MVDNNHKSGEDPGNHGKDDGPVGGEPGENAAKVGDTTPTDPDTRVDGDAQVDTPMGVGSRVSVDQIVDSDDGGYQYSEKDSRQQKNTRVLVVIVGVMIVAVTIAVIALFAWLAPDRDDEHDAGVDISVDGEAEPGSRTQGGAGDRDSVGGGASDNGTSQGATDGNRDDSDTNEEPDQPAPGVSDSEASLYGNDGANEDAYHTEGRSPIGGGAQVTGNNELRQNAYNDIQETFDTLGSIQVEDDAVIQQVANQYLYTDLSTAYTLFSGHKAGWVIDYDQTEVFEPTNPNNEPRVSVVWVTGDGQKAFELQGYYDTVIGAFKPNYTEITGAGHQSTLQAQ